MLAEPGDAGHLVAQIEIAVHEGVSELRLAPLQVAGVMSELVGCDAERVHRFRRVVVIATVVYVVVPGRAADPRAHCFVAGVEFGEQVQAIGDQATTEVTVAVVQVGVGGELVGGLLHAPGVAVLDGVVPADRQVLVTSVELESLHRQDRTG